MYGRQLNDVFTPMICSLAGRIHPVGSRFAVLNGSNRSLICVSAVDRLASCAKSFPCGSDSVIAKRFI